MSTATFDPARYKNTTRAQWEAAAAAWDRWDPTLSDWLGAATERMLDLAGVAPGGTVLDVAAGGGGADPGAGPRGAPAGRPWPRPGGSAGPVRYSPPTSRRRSWRTRRRGSPPRASSTSRPARW